MIKVSVNNQSETFEAGTSVSQALEILGYAGKEMLGVAVNQMFVSKDNWENTVLKDFDQVDILNPVSGG